MHYYIVACDWEGNILDECYAATEEDACMLYNDDLEFMEAKEIGGSITIYQDELDNEIYFWHLMP